MSLGSIFENSGAAPDGIRLAKVLTALGARGVAYMDGTSLFDHLVGTCTNLERWGCREEICKAGLYHCVYGTPGLENGLMSLADRPLVSRLIGPPAERLAWLLCQIDRNLLTEVCESGEPHLAPLLGNQGQVEITPAELRALVTITWAATLDQTTRIPISPELRQARAGAVTRILALLPVRARTELTAALGASAQIPDLATVLAIDDDERFLSGYWPDRLYYGRGALERFGGALYDDLKQIVRLPVQLIRGLSRSAAGRAIALPLSADQVLPLYDAGLTIHLHGLTAPAFVSWIRAIEARLGLPTGSASLGCFASRRGPGVAAHYDRNDNIVIQVKGTKRWRIAPNAHVINPTVGYVINTPPGRQQRAEVRDDLPSEMPADHAVFDLTPGAVLFVPRGHWHDCESLEDESLHFNVQCSLTTKRDIILTALGRLLRGNVQMRERLARPFAAGVLRPELRADTLASLRELVGTLTEADLTILESDFAATAARRPPAV